MPLGRVTRAQSRSIVGNTRWRRRKHGAKPARKELSDAFLAMAVNFTDQDICQNNGYGQSSLFEQTTPSVVELVDNNASVSGTAFTDLDLDGYQIGGRVVGDIFQSGRMNAVSWLVAHYNVYLSDGLGINRSQINGALAFTATSVEA
eukprot:s126_g20.t1